MKLLITILFLLPIFGICQDVKYIPFGKLSKDSLPNGKVLSTSEETFLPYQGDGIWWNTIIKNDSLFVYDSNDIDVEYYGDSLDFDLYSINELIRKNRIRTMGNHHYKKVKNGWFWVSEDKNQIKKLGDANVNKIFDWRDRTVLLEGVSHGSISEGYLIEVKNDLTLDTLIVFPESPYGACIASNESLLVLTDYQLFKVDAKGEMSCLYIFDDWPTSYRDITLFNHQIYIGMQHGIARYDIINDEIEWFRITTE